MPLPPDAAGKNKAPAGAKANKRKRCLEID